MSLEPKEVEEIARDYIDRLSLDYEVQYGNVEVANFTDRDCKVPGEFMINVTLTDSDATSLDFELYVDAESGKLREEKKWNPTKEQIEDSMTGGRQYYVLAVVDNKASAKSLVDLAYDDENVAVVEYGSRKVLDALRGALASTSLRQGQRNSYVPEEIRVKPEEQERTSTLGYPNSILNP